MEQSPGTVVYCIKILNRQAAKCGPLYEVVQLNHGARKLHYKVWSVLIQSKKLHASCMSFTWLIIVC